MKALNAVEAWADDESDGEEFLRDAYGMESNDCNIYDDIDIKGAVLPPSVAVEVLSGKEAFQPDLMHLEEDDKQSP